MTKPLMTAEQVQECKSTFLKLSGLNIGNPDLGGKWYHFEDYEDYLTRETVLYWETLLQYLQKAGMPHTLPKAIKYQVMSPFNATWDKIFALLHWLERNPEYL